MSDRPALSPKERADQLRRLLNLTYEGTNARIEWLPEGAIVLTGEAEAVEWLRARGYVPLTAAEAEQVQRAIGALASAVRSAEPMTLTLRGDYSAALALLAGGDSQEDGQ